MRRMAQRETSGDKRRFDNKKVDVKSLLLRLWKYMGRNRLLVILAAILSITSSVLSLYGPKLSGQAINAIEKSGIGKVDFGVITECVLLMLACYIASAILSYSEAKQIRMYPSPPGPNALPGAVTTCVFSRMYSAVLSEGIPNAVILGNT